MYEAYLRSTKLKLGVWTPCVPVYLKVYKSCSMYYNVIQYTKLYLIINIETTIRLLSIHKRRFKHWNRKITKQKFESVTEDKSCGASSNKVKRSSIWVNTGCRRFKSQEPSRLTNEKIDMLFSRNFAEQIIVALNKINQKLQFVSKSVSDQCQNQTDNTEPDKHHCWCIITISVDSKEGDTQ